MDKLYSTRAHYPCTGCGEPDEGRCMLCEARRCGKHLKFSCKVVEGGLTDLIFSCSPSCNGIS